MSTDGTRSASPHEHDVATHDEWDELAVGYAMSALEPDELQRFVDHLVVTCPQCRQSVSDMSEVGASLSSAIRPPVTPEPSVGLRASVLAAAFAERPAVPQNAAALVEFAPVHAATAISAAQVPVQASPAAPIDELAARRSRKLPERAGWLAAAAAAIVALVLSVTTATTVHSRNQQSAMASDLSNAMSAIARGGSATTVPLSDSSGHTIATVVARAHSVTVVTQGVKANSANNTYVLWGMKERNGTPLALGDFDLASDAVHSVQVAADARGAYSSMQMFGLSVEPGHTPPAKPSTILALGQR